MSRRLLACMGLALSLSACGTTVSQISQGVPSTAEGLGQVQQPNDGATTALVPQGQGAAVTAGSTSGASAPGPTVASGSTSSAARVTGRGVTDRTLTIGAAIATGAEAAGNLFGISGSGGIPELDMWNAVIRDVNATGGVLGRKLVLQNHSVDLAGYIANPDQTYNEVCSDFKDDHKVFAVMITISDPALRKCTAAMGSPLVVYGANVASIIPEAAFREHNGSYLYVPDGITQERLAKLFVDSLVANSFTAKWDTNNGGPGLLPVKLGLIHADTPDQNNLYAAYTRELAKHGLRFTSTVTYSGSVTDALGSTQSAVLKFAAEGITHVFGASAFFLRDAESQHYRPRYAFLPALGAFGAANSPPAQLKGAQTVGWAPTQDVYEPQDPGKTAGAARCAAVMQRAGLQTRGNRQDLKLMFAVCDAVYSFRDALTLGQQPTIAGLRRGYDGLGARFGPALTFEMNLGPTHHSGVQSVRDMAFDSACSCLKYSSRTNRS